VTNSISVRSSCPSNRGLFAAASAAATTSAGNTSGTASSSRIACSDARNASGTS
jgi:hypothetical protein